MGRKKNRFVYELVYIEVNYVASDTEDNVQVTTQVFEDEKQMYDAMEEALDFLMQSYDVKTVERNSRGFTVILTDNHYVECRANKWMFN